MWMLKQPDMSPDDCRIVTGNFNAQPDSQTYAAIKSFGFTSTHHHVHGSEPKITFPTGLQAEFMDKDPPMCLDYIWVKGNVTIANCQLDKASQTCDPNDPTVFGSDHMALVVDLIL